MLLLGHIVLKIMKIVLAKTFQVNGVSRSMIINSILKFSRVLVESGYLPVPNVIA